MRRVRSAFVIFLVGTCLGTASSRAEIRCATGDAGASIFAPHGFDVVPCADEEQGRRLPDGKAGAQAATDLGPLIDWIIEKTGWAVRDAPPIKFASQEELAKMFGGTADDYHVEALYSDRDHSIYLPEGWKADDLRRHSILLHELVHHLQYLNHVKVTCVSEYELQAFKLQVTWLNEQGVEDPLDLLGIDPFLLFMLGHCDEMSNYRAGKAS